MSGTVTSRTHRPDSNAVIRCLEPLALYAPYWMEFLGCFFLVLTIVGERQLQRHHKGRARVRAGRHRQRSDGDGVYGRPRVRRALQPGGDVRCVADGRGKITTAQSIGYVLVQLLGSFIAALVYWSISKETFALAPAHGITHGHAFSAEAMYTFLLVSVVLNVATTKSQADNSFYGLAIGFTVLAGAISVGPISGGGFNPAVGFGPIIVNAIDQGSSNASTMWIYWLGPAFGSVLAAIAFRITNHHKEYRANDLAAIVDVRERVGSDAPMDSTDVGLNTPGAPAAQGHDPLLPRP